MPRVSLFYGIEVYIYYEDHQPPHFHAIHGESELTVKMAPLAAWNGTLPKASKKKLLEWAGKHLLELKSNWQRAQNGQEPVAIDPLP